MALPKLSVGALGGTISMQAQPTGAGVQPSLSGQGMVDLLPQLTSLAEVQVHGGWVGSRMTALESASGARVAFLTRLGEGLVPSQDTVYQEGDLVHVAMRHDQVASVEQSLASPPAKDEQ